MMMMILLLLLLYSSLIVVLVNGIINDNNHHLHGKDEHGHRNNNNNDQKVTTKKKMITDSPYQVIVDKVSHLLDQLHHRPENAFPAQSFQESHFDEHFPRDIFQNKSKMEELFSWKRGLCSGRGSGGQGSGGRGSSGRGKVAAMLPPPPSLPTCHLLRDLPTPPVLQSPINLTFPHLQPSMKYTLKTYFAEESERYLSQIIQDRYGGHHDISTSHNTTTDGDTTARENCRAYSHHLHKQKTTASSSSCPSNPSERSNLIIARVGPQDSCHLISIFFRSLRDADICADVVLLRDTDNKNDCDMIELSCSTVHFEDGIDHDFPRLDSQYSFPIAALQYLNRHLQLMIRNEEDPSTLLCKRVLLVEAVNVFFQADPFQTFHLDQTDAEVILSDLSYGQDRKFNSIGRSLKDFSKQAFFDHADYSSTVGDFPVLSPGIIYGGFFGVFKLLWMTAYIYDRNFLPSSPTGSMTALNIMYYSGLLSRIVKVKVLPPSLNFFIEAASYHPRKQRSQDQFHHLTNPLVNLFGEPYAIIRSYRVWHMMTIVEDWVLQYGGLDWKFNAVAPPKGCGA